MSWRYTGLSGFYFYQILDFGGLIVAVKIPPKSPTAADAADAKLVYFSTDEGRCWHRRKFTDQDIQVKGSLRRAPNVLNLLSICRILFHYRVEGTRTCSYLELLRN